MSFQRFPDLPPELRRWIIYLSIEPRTVRVRWNGHIQQCTTPDNPVIMQVSQEARSEVLKVFLPCFQTSLGLGPRTLLWLTPERDTVSIDWKSFAEGEGALGVITGQFPVPSEADNIISLEVHCDELRKYITESMRESRSYLKNLRKLHVVGCKEPQQVRAFLREDPSKMNAVGDKTWPELTCDLNLDGSYCCVHNWFEEWNSIRYHQEQEWAPVFSRHHDIAQRSHQRRQQSRIGSLRYRQRVQQKLFPLYLGSNPQ